MAEQRVQRRLAAILAADVVGYSRLMREDETGTGTPWGRWSPVAQHEIARGSTPGVTQRGREIDGIMPPSIRASGDGGPRNPALKSCPRASRGRACRVYTRARLTTRY